METPWLNIKQMKQISRKQKDSLVSKFVAEINRFDELISSTHDGESPFVCDVENPIVLDWESPGVYKEESFSVLDCENPGVYKEGSSIALDCESPRVYKEESSINFVKEGCSDLVSESPCAYVEENYSAVVEESLSPLDEKIDSAQIIIMSNKQKQEKQNSWKQSENLFDKNEPKEKQPKECLHESTLDEQGTKNFISKKTPFTIHAEIDQFLHEPIFGSVDKNIFEFKFEDPKSVPIFNPKLMNKTVSYMEEPHCLLAFLKLHDLLQIHKTKPLRIPLNPSNPSRTVAIPLHGNKKTNNFCQLDTDCTHIFVPVILGEFRIEAVLEDSIQLSKEVFAIKDVSKEVVIMECRFVPSKFYEKFKNGTRNVLKGMLIIEGFVHQNIEYTSIKQEKPNLLLKVKENHKNYLNQKMVLELIIHLLQTQKVCANCTLADSKINYFE